MTTTRRAFLQGVILGACALPGWTPERRPPELRPAGRRPAGLMQLDQVIFDARRSQALAFAETAQRLGTKTRAISGDISDRWFGDLRARLRTKRTPLAGITDFRSLFLLQTMAADAGLHPLLRIHHWARGETAAHETFGAQAYRAMFEPRLAHCGECWATEAARLVLSLPELAANTPRHASNMNEANLRALGSRALVTWVMA